MTNGFPSPQPNGTSAKVKRAICHIRTERLWLAVVIWLLPMQTPAAQAQSAVRIEQTFSGSLTAMPSENLGVSGAFYIPVYSSVAMSQGKLRADFSVTLSIHNASETRPLVLRRVAYFDTGGKMVENYLKAPVALKPFSTVEVCSFRRPMSGAAPAPISWWTGRLPVRSPNRWSRR